jgi:hypothetical protein
MALYLVYKLVGKVGKQRVVYYGMTQVLGGQSYRQALAVRKQWHLVKPNWCLRGGKLVISSMNTVKVVGGKSSALALEAMETAKEHQASNPKEVMVRGGPWCKRGMNKEDLDCLKEVADCSGYGSVMAVASRYPGHVLGAHLRGESYKTVPRGVALNDLLLHSAKQAPLSIQSTSRSGTRTSGKSGQSGWLKFRRGERVGSRKWPSNWKAMPAWRANNL